MTEVYRAAKRKKKRYVVTRATPLMGVAGHYRFKWEAMFVAWLLTDYETAYVVFDTKEK